VGSLLFGLNQRVAGLKVKVLLGDLWAPGGVEVLGPATVVAALALLANIAVLVMALTSTLPGSSPVVTVLVMTLVSTLPGSSSTAVTVLVMTLTSTLPGSSTMVTVLVMTLVSTLPGSSTAVTVLVMALTSTLPGSSTVVTVLVMALISTLPGSSTAVTGPTLAVVPVLVVLARLAGLPRHSGGSGGGDRCDGTGSRGLGWLGREGHLLLLGGRRVRAVLGLHAVRVSVSRGDHRLGNRARGRSGSSDGSRRLRGRGRPSLEPRGRLSLQRREIL